MARSFKIAFKTLTRGVEWILNVLLSALSKFWWDDCFSRAASLAYSSLFALVPASALIFGFFNAFNVDSGFVTLQLNRIVDELLPQKGNDQLVANLNTQLGAYLTELAAVVTQLGLLSLPVLVISGIALVNTIEGSLNVVWRVSSKLGLISKIINFWAVTTLGPLLVLVSFYWYARVTASPAFDIAMQSSFIAILDIVVPVLAIFMALTIMFYKLPASRVALRDAMIGALVSAILFEMLKRFFAFYIGSSTSYQSFYGVLVTLPLFLFWLYLTWVVVLFGAEVSYQAGSISVLSGLKKYASELGDIGGILGLRILCVIGVRFSKGQLVPTESEIAIETGSDPVLVRTCLDILSDAGLITSSDPDSHSRSLTVSPDKLSIGDIAVAFRSKQYRARVEAKGLNINGEVQFLEALRNAARIVDPKLPVRQWTLADILYGLNKTINGNEKVS